MVFFFFLVPSSKKKCFVASDSIRIGLIQHYVFFLFLSCVQKNIVHRDLKLGNMVLNKR